uniref:NADH dehydrogenase subunit 6 n=1 Tax=Synergus sp. ZJUH_2016033 TaxID=2491171 RepID=A0A3Q8UAE4_9HYME|nr:NADH dehydrogenase subunit 6 [Synergus sp. ZJUH_2016033]
MMKITMLMKFFQSYLFIYLLMMCLMLLLISSNIKNIHPLILGLMMFIYSILISLNLNIFNKSNVYSMIMFLIIIGGFLIMFLYFNSFAINNKMIFNLNMFNKFIFMLMMMMICMILMLFKNNIFNMILFLNNKNLEMKTLMYSNIKMNNYNINMLYLKYNKLILFSLIYLLYSLIIIMKIIFLINPKFLRQLI